MEMNKEKKKKKKALQYPDQKPFLKNTTEAKIFQMNLEKDDTANVHHFGLHWSKTALPSPDFYDSTWRRNSNDVVQHG